MQLGLAAAAVALVVGSGGGAVADVKYGVDHQTGQSRKVQPGWYIMGLGLLLGGVMGFKGVGGFAALVGLGAGAVEVAKYASNKAAASQAGTQGLLPSATESQIKSAFNAIRGARRREQSYDHVAAN